MQLIELHPSVMCGTYSSSAASTFLPALVFGPFRVSSTPYSNGAYAANRPLLEVGSSQRGSGFLYIMKGTPPASPDDLISFADYNDDILVSFDMSGNGAQFAPTRPLPNDTITELNYSDTLHINTIYKAAIASGEATWVCICSRVFTGTGLTDDLYHSVIGTIGNMSSGADLVIPSTNVVEGKLYRVVDLKLQLSLQITY